MGYTIAIYKLNCPICNNIIYEGKTVVTNTDIENNVLEILECDKCGEFVNIVELLSLHLGENYD